VPVEVPDLPTLGRRAVDRALADDFLARLPEMGDAELAEVQQRLAEAEADVSRQRRAVFEASDRIQAELVRRYRVGLPGDGAVLPG
jgi:phage gp36-like protein